MRILANCFYMMLVPAIMLVVSWYATIWMVRSVYDWLWR